MFIPKNPCSSHVHPTSHSPLFPPPFPPRVHRSPSSPGSAVRGQCRPSPPPAHRPQIQVDPLGSQKAIRTGWKWEVHSFFWNPMFLEWLFLGGIQCFWKVLKKMRINVEIGLELDFYVEILEILLWKKCDPTPIILNTLWGIDPILN